ncbi:MAG: type II toxin-antitoxin system PemK/MazF family toxin [Gemmatimonadota bacterium]|nr:type II toxin-antitoxin system PemK/MazF family toxin [Gemmatimonadota bacterium]
MKQNTPPGRGEIWIVDLQPTRGREARTQGRALVISVNELNHGAAGIAMVLPMSDVDQRIATHVTVPAGEAMLAKDGFVKCEEVRSMSIERLTKRVGAVKPATMAMVMRNVGVLLGM